MKTKKLLRVRFLTTALALFTGLSGSLSGSVGTLLYAAEQTGEETSLDEGTVEDLELVLEEETGPEASFAWEVTHEEEEPASTEEIALPEETPSAAEAEQTEEYSPAVETEQTEENTSVPVPEQTAETPSTVETEQLETEQTEPEQPEEEIEPEPVLRAGTVEFAQLMDKLFEEEIEDIVLDEEEFEKSIEVFPESYRVWLREIHEEYPSWRFVPQEMGIDFEEAVDAENVLGISLVYTGSPSSWKSLQPGAYDWETGKWRGMDGNYWVAASREIIEYYMDPRNYLDSTYVFAFLDYSYDPELQTLPGLYQIIKGTYLEGTFTENDKTYNYVDVIMEAAKESGMNPYLIASTILVENGLQGTGRSISGTVEGYEGIYNYFNIGAYATATMGTIERGLWVASLVPSNPEKTYLRPWDSRYKSIRGCALYYSNSFIKQGQDTLYKKKFNIVNGRASHQYLTNIQAVSIECRKLGQGYTEDMRKTALVFRIPIYENLPEEDVPKPWKDGSPNYKLRSISVDGYRLNPIFDMDTLEYDVAVRAGTPTVEVEAVPMDEKAAIKGAGTIPVETGENIVELEVTAENGDVLVYTLNVTVRPDWVEAGPVTVTSPYNIEEEIVTGLVPGMTAEEFLDSLTVEGGTAALITEDGSEAERAGTGCLLQIYNEAGEVEQSYMLVLYGDANKDGRITSADLLRIQRSILQMTTLDESSKEAADANHDGKVNSADLLRIQKAILGMTEIVQ